MSLRVFKHTVRIPYADVDPMGFVYYANYLVYFEMARSELLREAGLPYGDLEKRGVMLPVVGVNCEYRKPAHFDDLLILRTRCVEFRGVRLRIEYEVTRKAGTQPLSVNDLGPIPDERGADEELLVTGSTEHVCVGRDGRVMKPVPELRKLVNEGAA